MERNSNETNWTNGGLSPLEISKPRCQMDPFREKPQATGAVVSSGCASKPPINPERQEHPPTSYLRKVIITLRHPIGDFPPWSGFLIKVEPNKTLQITINAGGPNGNLMFASSGVMAAISGFLSLFAFEKTPSCALLLIMPIFAGQSIKRFWVWGGGLQLGEASNLI